MKFEMKQNSEDKSGEGKNSTGGANLKIRIAVFGQHQVGKSALTVRYLTRRYIGEYKSNTDLLYKQTVTVGLTSIDVEIVDISTSVRTTLPVEEIQRADAFLIVYSITDRSSFNFAQNALEMITSHYNQSSQTSLSASSGKGTPQLKPTCPILLIANKSDMEHVRSVEKVEGLSLSIQHGCQFYELSVAENSPEVYTSFQTLISTFVPQSQQPSKRKFSVSKMLGNLRLGRTSPPHQIQNSQASVIDTNVDSDEGESSEHIPFRPRWQTPTREMSPISNGSTSSGISNSICHLKSKLVELHSMRKRQNSPPICSL